MEKGSNIILLVDDDEDDLLILNQILKASGAHHEIHQAFNGKEALLKLNELEQAGTLPSLIIMDVNMPKMDGKQTLLAIKADELLADVPVVIFTTSSSEADKLFFKKHNVEMITKPAEFKTIISLAEKLLSFKKN